MSSAVADTRAGPRTRLTPRAGALVVAVTALLFYLVVPLRTYMQQRADLEWLERKTEVLESQNARLRREIEKLHDPAYLERIARECLGMVRPGEMAFVIVPKGGRPTPPAC